MQWVVRRALRFRWLAVFAAAATMAVGLAHIPSAKVDVFPEFAPPRVEIQTAAVGNSSNEVEELITVPIEQQLNGLPGLEQLRSKSVAQLSSIELVFERGTDELRARQLVDERLAQIGPTLPSWSVPPFMMPALSATSRIMKIGLTSDELSLIELSSVAYRKVRARLLRVPGVAQVAIGGQRPQQRHVQVDPAKLARDGISLEEGLDALSTTYRMVRGGDPDHADTRALSLGWSEATLGYLHRLSCEDPLSGLASTAHLRSRLAELYRGQRDGAAIRDTHALVVVEVPAARGTSHAGTIRVEQALRASRVGDLVRTVFTGTETVGRVGPRKVVVMCERDDRLGPRVAELRRGLVGIEAGVPAARAWIEALPDREAEAASLLERLARA